MVGELDDDVDYVAVDLVQPTVLLYESVCCLVQRLDVLFYVGWLVPRQLAARLHFAVHVSHALFEVLKLLQHHGLLRVDDFLIHIVVLRQIQNS